MRYISFALVAALTGSACNLYFGGDGQGRGNGDDSAPDAGSAYVNDGGAPVPDAWLGGDGGTGGGPDGSCGGIDGGAPGGDGGIIDAGSGGGAVDGGSCCGTRHDAGH